MVATSSVKTTSTRLIILYSTVAWVEALRFFLGYCSIAAKTAGVMQVSISTYIRAVLHFTVVADGVMFLNATVNLTEEL